MRDYEREFPYTVTRATDRHKEVIEWFIENMEHMVILDNGIRKYSTMNTEKIIYGFTNEADAIMFRLKFL